MEVLSSRPAASSQADLKARQTALLEKDVREHAFEAAQAAGELMLKPTIGRPNLQRLEAAIAPLRAALDVLDPAEHHALPVHPRLGSLEDQIQQARADFNESSELISAVMAGLEDRNLHRRNIDTTRACELADKLQAELDRLSLDYD